MRPEIARAAVRRIISRRNETGSDSVLGRQAVISGCICSLAYRDVANLTTNIGRFRFRILVPQEGPEAVLPWDAYWPELC